MLYILRRFLNMFFMVVMGSRSDLPCMEKTIEMLKEFKISYEVRAISAHRTPQAVLKMAEQAKDNGVKVIIAGAGGAAHLAGVIASSTTLPVIGVPLHSKYFGGQDALYSIVMTPPGVPVATVAIDGAVNAALLAMKMLAIGDEELSEKLAAYGENMKTSVEKKAEKIKYEEYLKQM